MDVGDRVYVLWQDMSVSCHSDEPCGLVLTESVGWVERIDGDEIELVTTRYVEDGSEYKDRVAIHAGVVVSWEVI